MWGPADDQRPLHPPVPAEIRSTKLGGPLTGFSAKTSAAPATEWAAGASEPAEDRSKAETAIDPAGTAHRQRKTERKHAKERDTLVPFFFHAPVFSAHYAPAYGDIQIKVKTPKLTRCLYPRPPCESLRSPKRTNRAPFAIHRGSGGPIHLPVSKWEFFRK